MASDSRRRQYGENLHHYAKVGVVAWHLLGIIVAAAVGLTLVLKALLG